MERMLRSRRVQAFLVVQVAAACGPSFEIAESEGSQRRNERIGTSRTPGDGSVGVWIGGSSVVNHADGVDGAMTPSAPADSGIDPPPTQAIQPTCIPTGPEICDGKDNDCNGTTDDGPICGSEVLSFGSSTYLFCAQVESWVNAAAVCALYGQHLVTIDSEEEDVFLGVTVAGMADIGWWMGFNERVTENAWVWADGSPTTYVHWAKEQPSEHSGNEDCGVLKGGPNAGWKAVPCEQFLPFVCESVGATP
jgi:hypothetical protein